MDFNLTEEQILIQATARDFAETEVRPEAVWRDRESAFPYQLLGKCGTLGFTGALIPPEYQGAGLDYLSYVLIIEELARVDPALAVTLSVHNSVACHPLVNWGTKEQKNRYLPGLATGKILGAFSLTEPQAGSDAANLKTKAVRQADRFILNGVKSWCTNGPAAGMIIVLAVTDPAAGSRGISAFLVEPAFPGFSIGSIEDKMGLRSSLTSEIILQDCEVPAGNLLGKEGDGLRIALSALSSSRISIGAQAVGLARGAFEEALAYSRTREAFGQKIFDFQSIQFSLADMATRLDAARLLVYAAACRQDSGHGKVDKLASMCKLFASEMANAVAGQAVQIHGAYGYSREYPVERFFRDARVTTIYEGSSEIQRLIIARELLRDSGGA